MALGAIEVEGATVGAVLESWHRQSGRGYYHSHPTRVDSLTSCVVLLNNSSMSNIHLRNIKTRISVAYAHYQRAILCPRDVVMMNRATVSRRRRRGAWKADLDRANDGLGPET